MLYTKGEREQDLKEGFRGRLAIGSGIMTQLGLGSWDRLISQIKADCNQGDNYPKVFLCGSIFGGTGASGFPTLGRRLFNDLKEGNILNFLKSRGLLMLPYFSFSSPGQDEKEVFARSEEFILKTETALRYYGSQDWSDAVYLLGMPSLTKIEDFSTGGASQRNQPHILELYGAMALRDFIFTDKPEKKEVVLLSRKESNTITWDDLPDKVEARQKLVNAARFAYGWLSGVVPDLKHARTKPGDIFYVPRFYRNQMLNQTDEWDKIKAIENWAKAYLTWLGTLHSSVSGLDWFNCNAFFKKGELQIDRENFRDIFGHFNRIEFVRVLKKLNNEGIQGENKGTVGLAKALYRVIDSIKV